jgi:peroxiredoxin Q/BCP
VLELLGIGVYKPIAGARACDAAPDFTLKDQNNRDVSLKDLLGEKPLVLAFYPRANSPVCTKQMCSLRDHDEELRKRARMVGVSYSSVANMQRFIQELGLKMDMLSDADKSVARKYGAYGWFAPARVTFVIDKAGVIRAVISNVSASSHAEQIIAALKEVGV